MGRPNGRGPSWCAMPTISWCWRAIKGLVLTGWIESKLEGLARVGDQSGENASGETEGSKERVWTFWDITFRYYDDLKGRGWRYLNVSPVGESTEEESGKSCTR